LNDRFRDTSPVKFLLPMLSLDSKTASVHKYFDQEEIYEISEVK